MIFDEVRRIDPDPFGNYLITTTLMSDCCLKENQTITLCDIEETKK